MLGCSFDRCIPGGYGQILRKRIRFSFFPLQKCNGMFLKLLLKNPLERTKSLMLYYQMVVGFRSVLRATATIRCIMTKIVAITTWLDIKTILLVLGLLAVWHVTYSGLNRRYLMQSDTLSESTVYESAYSVEPTEEVCTSPSTVVSE